MAKKLTDEEIHDIIERMSAMLFTPDGKRLQAETGKGQTAIDTAIKVLLIAMAVVHMPAEIIQLDDFRNPEAGP